LDEVFAVLKFIAKGQVADGMENRIQQCPRYKEDEDIKFCDDMLGKVSRSFSAVIR
jgi:hypothetical protein